MGFLTTVTIYNDYIHNYEKDPALLGKEIIDGRYIASHQIFGAYHAGGIKIQPSRHADDHTVYLHMGNTVFNLGQGTDLRNLVVNSPEVARKFIKEAKRIVLDAEKYLKNAQTEQKLKKQK